MRELLRTGAQRRPVHAAEPARHGHAAGTQRRRELGQLGRRTRMNGRLSTSSRKSCRRRRICARRSRPAPGATPGPGGPPRGAHGGGGNRPPQLPPPNAGPDFIPYTAPADFMIPAEHGSVGARSAVVADHGVRPEQRARSSGRSRTATSRASRAQGHHGHGQPCAARRRRRHGRRPAVHRHVVGSQVPRIRRRHAARCSGATTCRPRRKACPAVYSVGGKQYVAIAVGGNGLFSQGLDQPEPGPGSVHGVRARQQQSMSSDEWESDRCAVDESGSGGQWRSARAAVVSPTTRRRCARAQDRAAIEALMWRYVRALDTDGRRWLRGRVHGRRRVRQRQHSAARPRRA